MVSDSWSTASFELARCRCRRRRWHAFPAFRALAYVRVITLGGITVVPDGRRLSARGRRARRERDRGRRRRYAGRRLHDDIARPAALIPDAGVKPELAAAEPNGDVPRGKHVQYVAARRVV